MTMLGIRRFVLASSLGLFAALAAVPSDAQADASSPQAFIRTEHDTLTHLLQQPNTPQRNTSLSHELEVMVDYDELARRTFGHPCPASVPGCHDHWAELSDAQKTEVTGLLKKLVEKNYRKNLVKTLGYDVDVKVERDSGGETKVITEAQKKASRDPAIEIDYLVKGQPNAYKVVDIITERSSMAKNYYDQFHRMLTNPAQGYPFLVSKLQERTKNE